jgi:hypothetical protein
VVLPASGWEMMAKVRRRAISAAIASMGALYLAMSRRKINAGRRHAKVRAGARRLTPGFVVEMR